jgi:DNA-binding transcriptional regulator LsrR (DeoR family)
VISHRYQLLPSDPDYENVRLMSGILALYYQEGKSQKEIASDLGLSVAKVNRLLKQAREQGWVEINLHVPFQNMFELESKIQAITDIPEAVVVPCLSEDAEVALQHVGSVAANYLLQHLRDGDTICISGGKALYAIVEALHTKRRYDIQVVPATGGVQGRHYTDVNYLAAQLADRLGGRAFQLHAPIFVDTRQERETLMALRQVSEILDLARQAQIALVGVGSIIPASPSYFDLTSLDVDDRRRIVEEESGSGEVLAHIYDAQGQPCALQYNQRVIGLGLTELRSIPLSIGVAASEQKILPICGALRGGYLKTIIMDEVAARGVLDSYAATEVREQVTEDEELGKLLA